MIPTLYDIIEFVFFKAIPITVLVLLVLTQIFRYKRNTVKGNLFYAQGVVLAILLILFLWISRINFFSGLIFVLPILVAYLSFCGIFVIIFYLFYDRKKSYALTYILFIVAVFLFFYPKQQNWYRNEKERIVPAVSCECVGFSDEGRYASPYLFNEARCFGVPLQCRESIQDRCPFLPPGEECITIDVSELS